MSELSIVINDAVRATQAAKWCKRNRINYDLEYWGWPGSKKYCFKFKTDNDLMIFSLKWV